MKLAAITAARHAVSSFGLAALAVSAMLVLAPREAPLVVEARPDVEHVYIRAITVVGSADYDTMAAAVRAYESQLAPCALATRRVTVYAHFSGGTITDIVTLGGEQDIERCTSETLSSITVPVLDEIDVMIPIDLLSTRTASSSSPD